MTHEHVVELDDLLGGGDGGGGWCVTAHANGVSTITKLRVV